MSKSEWCLLMFVLLLAAALGLPYLQKSREESRRATCDWQMVLLSQSLFRQHELQGTLPGYREAKERNEARFVVTWVEPLLPYLDLVPTKEEKPEQEGSFAYRFDLSRTGKYSVLQQRTQLLPLAMLALRPLRCPAVKQAEDFPERIQFVVNTGMIDAEATPEFPSDWLANGVFHDRFVDRDHPARIVDPLGLDDIEASDGRSFTLLFSENLDAGDWTFPLEARVGFVWAALVQEDALARDPRVKAINEGRGLGDGSIAFARPSSLHVGGVNTVYADGRSAFLNERIDYEVFLRMMTVDDSELRIPGDETLLPPPLGIVRPTAEPAE